MMATGDEFPKPPAGELTNKPIPSELVKAKVAKISAKVAALQEKPSVLIIIGDNDIHFGDDQSLPAFISVFKNLGYKVRIEESKDTSYSTWEKFDVVVWSSGDDYSAVNIKSMEMLVGYVAHGGRLLLESGNIAAWSKEFAEATILNREFREKVLHATTDWVYHDVGDLTLKNEHPIATTPNKLPNTIGFTPTESGDYSGDTNAVRILPDATGIYGWSYVAYGSKLVNENVASNSYGLIVSEINNGGRVVYFAFDIDDIEDVDIQQKLIQNSVSWLLPGFRGEEVKSEPRGEEPSIKFPFYGYDLDDLPGTNGSPNGSIPHPKRQKKSNGRNLTIGDVSGQFAAGENITQTQTLSASDKKELLDCLIQFQKETAKLGIPEDDMTTINGDLNAAIKEAKKEEPDTSKIKNRFQNTIDTIKEVGNTIEKVSKWEWTGKILKVLGKLGLTILL